MNHQFDLILVDTDSITFCKPDQTAFSPEEVARLLTELNSQFPPKIKLDLEDVFKTIIVVKAKNYILKTSNDKVKIKGSGLKSPNKEPALKEFINATIDLLLNDNQDQVAELYHKYVQEALNVIDIKRWVTKRTITKAVLSPKRANEQKVFDAIVNDSYQEGDKIYVYFTPEGILKQSKDWTGDHCPYRLLEKLYKTARVFSSIIDKNLFVNYSLKTKRKLINVL